MFLVNPASAEWVMGIWADRARASHAGSHPMREVDDKEALALQLRAWPHYQL